MNKPLADYNRLMVLDVKVDRTVKETIERQELLKTLRKTSVTRR